jgi:uracil-DNA glycosylase family 4
VPRHLDIVIDFLRQQQARGVTHVDLDDRARQFLIQLSKQQKAPTPRESTAARSVPLAPAGSATPPQHAVVTVEPAAPLLTSGSTKAEKLADLRRQLLTFPQKRGLSQLRQKLIFSQGNPDAAIVFVGEAPTHHDEQQEHPFAGAVGEKFDGILKAMGLSRAEVYLTHLVKYRPATKNQTTNNRAASPAELAAFLPVLAHEMEIVRPQVVIALGTQVSQALCQSTESLEALRGTWHEWQSLPIRTTESPSFLLTAANTKKRKFWEDILAVMEKAQLPINEKQRGFFLTK